MECGKINWYTNKISLSFIYKRYGILFQPNSSVLHTFDKSSGLLIFVLRELRDLSRLNNFFIYLHEGIDLLSMIDIQDKSSWAEYNWGLLTLMFNWHKEEIITHRTETMRKSMTYSEILSESLLLATCGNFVTTGSPMTAVNWDQEDAFHVLHRFRTSHVSRTQTS